MHGYAFTYNYPPLSPLEKIHSLSPSEKEKLPAELFTDLSEVESYLEWVEEKRQ
ncbi:MAG: hypothetical protein NC177_10355 [Ruminococcus flavefaciens]|nr:hypothetical protein [Ruminococcus flavefaciens]